jgi:hypothetical protein
MAQTFVTLAVILAISATAQSKPAAAWLGGGSGSSHKTAIVVHASSAAIGQAAQHAYIKAHYPGYRFIGHAFSFKGAKSYDIMTFADAHGKKHALIFDISEYFKPTTSTHLTNRSS